MRTQSSDASTSIDPNDQLELIEEARLTAIRPSAPQVTPFSHRSFSPLRLLCCGVSAVIFETCNIYKVRTENDTCVVVIATGRDAAGDGAI